MDQKQIDEFINIVQTNRSADVRKRIIMPGPIAAYVKLELASKYNDKHLEWLDHVPVIFKIRLDKCGLIIKTKPDVT